MMAGYTIGLDYGSNSVRAIVVDVTNGRELSQCVWEYSRGQNGIILSADPNLARQHPQDYLKGAELTIKGALAQAAKKSKKFSPSKVIGIGVDTTGSTPLPLDAEGMPLAFKKKFSKNKAAMAWLWKDHTGVQEAAEITQLAEKMRPEYLAKCGGVYSSEWFFSKVLHCLRTSPEVFEAAYTWAEIADWIPAVLSGTQAPGQMAACICAAGHKAMYNESWGGYPDKKFLSRLDKKLGDLRERLSTTVLSAGKSIGGLCSEWAKLTGLPEGIAISAGAFDAHLGAVGAGIKPGTLTKIIGTSTCDMMIASQRKALPDIPGLCGIVPSSIVPGYFGLEAGQSAVGDIFNWFVNFIKPVDGGHVELTKQASKLKPGESGLLALDWNNGNRTILVDQRLTGMLVGQTLYTTPAEIYRALIEATAFGALTIINRFEEYGVKVKEVINCGGIAEKNPLVMQIYANVTGRVMKISRSSQTCALGSAIAAAVAAGKKVGGYSTFAAAQKAMTGVKAKCYKPDPKAHATYKRLYTLYRKMHDSLGVEDHREELFDVMKTLIEIRDSVRKH